ncbi:MAG TPA: nuclease-related domain-containing protein, partial [Gammaproteobacteria bacterium]|nr:nuclease-related domain-containing protein [Gammaproteobacteria bacterium]
MTATGRLAVAIGGAVRITNAGRGIHQREIVGVDKLKTSLPDGWLAFTNLDLAISKGSREIDVVMIIDDRIVLIDLKDWHGKIRSDGGSWLQNDIDMGRSPVAKISENVRDVAQLLKKYLGEQARRAGKPTTDVVVPRVHGFVVLTGTKDRSGISPTEANLVFDIDTFIRMVQKTGDRIKYWG